jgi:hypothetical protein
MTLEDSVYYSTGASTGASVAIHMNRAICRLVNPKGTNAVSEAIWNPTFNSIFLSVHRSILRSINFKHTKTNES